MVDWLPISEPELLARIEQGYVRMPPAHQRLWEAIRITPERWQQHPHGDAGGGFWAVGVVGRTVIWYNDLEDGFNRSGYSAYGLIDDYWRNDDELDITIQFLANALTSGHDLLHMWSQFKRQRA